MQHPNAVDKAVFEIKMVPTRFRTNFHLNFNPFSEFLEYRSVEYCSCRVIAKLPVYSLCFY